MDIAVLADIHGNYEALTTCITYVLERGITDFIFLGDYLGELGFPQRTMDYLYRIRDKYHCIFIRGNKEEYWLNYQESGKWKSQDSTTGCLYAAYHNLTQEDLEFFSELDMVKVIRVSHMEPVILCHGSPRRVNEPLHPGQKNTCCSSLLEPGDRAYAQDSKA